jgi:hypothetical protein
MASVTLAPPRRAGLLTTRNILRPGSELFAEPQPAWGLDPVLMGDGFSADPYKHRPDWVRAFSV